MNDDRRNRRVDVTQKARNYANDDRSNLSVEDITQIVRERRWIYLGSTNVDFMLVWDHKKHVPIVLLVSQTTTKDVVISIWKPTYSKIPQGEPTAIQIWFAWRYSLASPKKTVPYTLAT